jgi:hypothetical protein
MIPWYALRGALSNEVALSGKRSVSPTMPTKGALIYIEINPMKSDEAPPARRVKVKNVGASEIRYRGFIRDSLQGILCAFQMLCQSIYLYDKVYVDTTQSMAEMQSRSRPAARARLFWRTRPGRSLAYRFR